MVKNYESLGELIRHNLVNYKMILELLKLVFNDNDNINFKNYNLLKLQLCNNISDIYLNNLIEISQLKELENIDWKKTDLVNKIKYNK